MKSTVKVVMFTSLALVVMFGIGGCKDEPADSGGPSNIMSDEHAGHDHGAEGEAVAEAIEQKVCPVMDKPINEEIFVVHDGKKVYFCCPACKGTFKADPEKYMTKLPQFKK